MKYMGSKRRIAKDIIPIMVKDRREGQYFVDLFCGGCNLIDKVEGNRIANDSNKYVVALLKEMQKDDFRLPIIDEELYSDIKNNKENYSDYIVGFAGTQLSFGSTWFGSYRRDSQGKRNYYNEALNNVMEQSKILKGIDILNYDYRDVEIPKNSIIYCDIPYNTKATKGKYENEFNHEYFYEWCIKKQKEGHKVFVSEYNMPEDRFECVWSKEINQRMNNNFETSKGVEKLFIVKQN